MARARGLQPLADAIFAQKADFDPEAAAAAYCNAEVPDAAAALAGAQDIMAEPSRTTRAARAELRRYYRAFGQIRSTAAKKEDSVYAPYYDYSEPLAKLPATACLRLTAANAKASSKSASAVDAERAAAITVWMFARKKTGGASALLVEQVAKDRLRAPDPPQP